MIFFSIFFEEGAPNAMTFSLKLSIAKDFDNDYNDMKSAKSIQFVTSYKIFVIKILIRLFSFFFSSFKFKITESFQKNGIQNFISVTIRSMTKGSVVVDSFLTFKDNNLNSDEYISNIKTAILSNTNSNFSMFNI